MIWWLKARLVPTSLAGGLLAFTVLTLVFQDASVILPSLTVNAGNTVVLASFTPLVVVGTLARSLDSCLPSAERAGTRPVRWMDTGLIMATMAAVAAVTWAGGALLDSAAVHQAGRNTLFLSGLMLCAHAFVGRAGVVVPTAWVFAVIFLGRRTASDYQPWAVTGLPVQVPHATTAAVAALLMGVALNQRMSRNTL